MLSLDKLSTALGRVSGWLSLPVDVIAAGSAAQEPARRELVDSLQRVCSSVDSAVNAASDALHALLKSRGDAAMFARSLENFDRDGSVRARFKPEGLCGEVDHLLVSTRSWVSSVKWTWGVNEINTMRTELSGIQTLDDSLHAEYDRRVDEIRRLGREFGAAKGKHKQEICREAVVLIDEFARELRRFSAQVREAKNAVVRGTRRALDQIGRPLRKPADQRKRRGGDSNSR